MWLKNYKYRIKMLELEYKFKEQELETNLLNYEKGLQTQMKDFALKCAAETADYEHIYHYGLQEKQSELVRLDALIQARTETSNHDKVVYERIINDKDEMIKMLNTTIDNLIASLSDVNANSTIINKSK